MQARCRSVVHMGKCIVYHYNLLMQVRDCTSQQGQEVFLVICIAAQASLTCHVHPHVEHTGAHLPTCRRCEPHTSHLPEVH